MPEIDKLFAGSIPENYDRYLVPLIFESFAQCPTSGCAFARVSFWKPLLEAAWSREH